MRVAVRINGLKCFLVAMLFPLICDAFALEVNKLEPLGFSSERLLRLDAAMKENIHNKELAGAVTLLARHGKLVSVNVYGQQDIASATPMKKDSIFRIYSMTKPITAVAMMILYEEGKWLPNDPIEKYIPEFKHLQVYAGQDKNGQLILEKPKHAPTIDELMTHTAGFSLGFYDTPVGKLYGKANLFESTSLADLIAKLAHLPLEYQPGERWEYSMSAEVQGYLVERLSGVSYEQFVFERIFKPLGMVDTSLKVPPEKLARLATIYQKTADNPLTPMARDPKVSELPAMPSGGGGLYSTAEDYFRFAQMLLNGGDLQGKRILSPSSVKLLRSNHVPDSARTGKYGIGSYFMQPGFGFAYGGGVYDDPLKVNSPVGAGTYLWTGLAGTWFWMDPTNDVIFIGLIQSWALSPGRPNLEELSRALVYQALVDPAK